MSVFRDEKRIAQLLEQIGGIETPVSEDLEERMISGLEAIAESGGGGSLPDVTAEDNGKLLGVNNGEWDKVTAPVGLPSIGVGDGGKIVSVIGTEYGLTSVPSNIYNVPFSVAVDGDTITPSTTAQFVLVKAAHDTGKLCRAVIDASAFGGSTNYAYPSGYTANKITWNMLEYVNGAYSLLEFDIDSSNAVHLAIVPLVES